MTAQELIKILKRFPKTATIHLAASDDKAVSCHQEIKVRAQCDQDAEWIIVLSINKNIAEKDEKISC